MHLREVIKQLHGTWVEPESGKRAEFAPYVEYAVPALRLRIEDEVQVFDDAVPAGACYWSRDGSLFLVLVGSGFYIAPFEGDGAARWFCRPGLDEIVTPPALPSVVVAHLHACVAVARAECRHAVAMWEKIVRDIGERNRIALPRFVSAVYLERPSMFDVVRLRSVLLGATAFGWAAYGSDYGKYNEPRGILEPASTAALRIGCGLAFPPHVFQLAGTELRFERAPLREQYVDARSPILRVLGDEEWRLVYSDGWSWSRREGFWHNDQPMDEQARRSEYEMRQRWMDEMLLREQARRDLRGGGSAKVEGKDESESGSGAGA